MGVLKEEEERTNIQIEIIKRRIRIIVIVALVVSGYIYLNISKTIAVAIMAGVGTAIIYSYFISKKIKNEGVTKYAKEYEKKLDEKFKRYFIFRIIMLVVILSLGIYMTIMKTRISGIPLIIVALVLFPLLIMRKKNPDNKFLKYLWR